ncbi:hypothetical protein GYN24_09930 [Lactococcus piscium]|uniref:Lipoprotein n=1 Tax=Pseudolactococcus paracarnosus TaxID=2749962 RepID=A0A7L4WG68_9LACT|nr:hypothetical protein [Lactococcus paracarnosus]MCJ1994898.1 hypothetical protein [Lactococcus paracarnosus]QDJ28483.1 hypothetical protein BHS01_08070 [Lactococcus paracarnosus]SPC35055.1 exported hypothetical protein [Lactococcus piscium]
MKKIIFISFSLLCLAILASCGKNATTQTSADYNISSFETALDNGEDLTDKTVVFNIEKTSHNILSGNYSLLAGNDNNLAFKSKKDPKVAKNDIVILKVKSTSGSSGKYNISYSDLSEIKKMDDVSIVHKKMDQKKLALNITDDQVADEDGKVKIKGSTSLPNTQVTIGMGIIGDSTTSDSKGDFILSYDMLNSLKTDSIKVTASIGDKKVTKTITLKQNQKIIESYEASVASAASKEKESKAANTTSATQEKKEPTPPAIQITFAELMDKLNSNQLVDGEIYTFTADVVSKSGKSYPVYSTDNLSNQFVRLADPNKISSNAPFYANPTDVLIAINSSSVTPTFITKIVNMTSYDDNEGAYPTFLITSINGKELNTSGFKAK